MERLRRIIAPGRFKHVCDALLAQRPETFRINTLRADENTVLHSLQQENVSYENSSLPLCFFFRDVSRKKIEASSAYQNGWIYLQNISSQIPVWVLDPQPGETILDLCAAPGGKSSQISALMQNRGRLIALEPDAIRYQKLVHLLNVLGSSATALHLRAESYLSDLKKNHPEQLFDRILIDAPCSGDGTFSAHRASTYAHWSMEFVQKMNVLQSKLLHLASSFLKVGGRLVYSTCSLSPEENEQVIHSFLIKNPSFRALPITPKILAPFLLPALSSWESQIFHPDVALTRRILPGKTTEGFFMSALVRVSPQ